MKKRISETWQIIDKYFEGFKTKFDPDIFSDEYQNHGPMKESLKGSRNKQQFLREMKAFSSSLPLESTKGDRGITIVSRAYDSEKNLTIVFYRMYFKNNLTLDVVDVFSIRNHKIFEITGVFDPRLFV